MWIFGFTGMHRFYYGKPISGFIYLCTLGLLGIGWIVDAFLIPSMDREAQGDMATPYLPRDLWSASPLPREMGQRHRMASHWRLIHHWLVLRLRHAQSAN